MFYFMNLPDYFYLFTHCGFFFHFCNQDFEINKGVGGRVCVTNKNVKTFIYIFFTWTQKSSYIISDFVTSAFYLCS